MAINLIKGQRVEIEAGLTHLKVEMGWKVNPMLIPHTTWMPQHFCWEVTDR